MNKRITDDEFDAAQQEVDRRLRAAARIDLARGTLDAFNAQWESLVAACSARRADDRERADVAIRAFAVEHGLIRDAYRIHFSTNTGRSGYCQHDDGREMRFDTAEQAQAKVDSWRSPGRVQVGFVITSYCVEPCP